MAKKSLNKSRPLVLKSYSRPHLLWLGTVSYILIIFIFAWTVLFFNGTLTLGGVPANIIWKFVQDPIALGSFFIGDSRSLHRRLESLGIEEEIKDYYRPHIADEVELDRYIHQLLYDRTGYVGYNYQVNPEGILVLKKSGERRVQQEVRERINKIYNQ